MPICIGDIDSNDEKKEEAKSFNLPSFEPMDISELITSASTLGKSASHSSRVVSSPLINGLEPTTTRAISEGRSNIGTQNPTTVEPSLLTIPSRILVENVKRDREGKSESSGLSVETEQQPRRRLDTIGLLASIRDSIVPSMDFGQLKNALSQGLMESSAFYQSGINVTNHSIDEAGDGDDNNAFISDRPNPITPIESAVPRQPASS